MSTTLSGWNTSIMIGHEATQGVEAATYPYLWSSEDSDSLTFGETPFDIKPLTGARGQKSTTFRVVQNLPGGALGASPMVFGTDSTETLKLLLTHFQSVSEAAIAAPYIYTFSPVSTPIAEGDFNTLSVIKDTGITDHAHLYTGCITDSMTIEWEQGGVLMVTPTLKAMESDNDATMPTVVAPSTGGYMQAPNIECTWNGTEVHPSKFSIESNMNTPDRQSGDARGRFNYVVGNWDAKVSMDVWRNEDSDTHWVSPFYDNAVGTLVITATMDSSYGEITGAVPVTMTYTAQCIVEAPNDLNTGKDDLVDSTELRVVSDSIPTLVINAESTGLVV